MEPDRRRPAFPEPPPGPNIFANRSPIDVPDEFPGVAPQFRSRRGAAALPVLRPAESAKGFGPGGWYAGFLCGVAAVVGGAVIVVLLFRGLV